MNNLGTYAIFIKDSKGLQLNTVKALFSKHTREGPFFNNLVIMKIIFTPLN